MDNLFLNPQQESENIEALVKAAKLDPVERKEYNGFVDASDVRKWLILAATMHKVKNPDVKEMIILRKSLEWHSKNPVLMIDLFFISLGEIGTQKWNGYSYEERLNKIFQGDSLTFTTNDLEWIKFGSEGDKNVNPMMLYDKLLQSTSLPESAPFELLKNPYHGFFTYDGTMITDETTGLPCCKRKEFRVVECSIFWSKFVAQNEAGEKCIRSMFYYFAPEFDLVKSRQNLCLLVHSIALRVWRHEKEVIQNARRERLPKRQAGVTLRDKSSGTTTDFMIIMNSLPKATQTTNELQLIKMYDDKMAEVGKKVTQIIFYLRERASCAVEVTEKHQELWELISHIIDIKASRFDACRPVKDVLETFKDNEISGFKAVGSSTGIFISPQVNEPLVLLFPQQGATLGAGVFLRLIYDVDKNRFEQSDFGTSEFMYELNVVQRFTKLGLCWRYEMGLYEQGRRYTEWNWVSTNHVAYSLNDESFNFIEDVGNRIWVSYQNFRQVSVVEPGVFNLRNAKVLCLGETKRFDKVCVTKTVDLIEFLREKWFESYKKMYLDIYGVDIDYCQHIKGAE